MRVREWDGHHEGSVLGQYEGDGQYEELDDDKSRPGAFDAVVIPRL